VIGTILNVAGILIGGIAGLATKTPLSAARQNYLKVALGAFTVFFGLRLTWLSLNGPFLQILKQLGIVLAALVLGKLAGRLMRLQKTSNRLGRFARERISAAKPADPNRFTTGFLTCSALLCAAPLGILGALCEGLPVSGTASGYFYPLAIKAVMDGLAVMGFVSIFGWGAALSAAPVLVFQGTITLLCERFLQPVLGAALMDSIQATDGLLIFCVALLIFEIRKIEVTDYLPSLVFAPLLAWWLR
jgi:uncharacterized membrane protein YqgA involved in biofilm formation